MRDEELLNQKEVAARLGVGVQTLRDWRRTGRFLEPVADRWWSWPIVRAWLAEQHASNTERRHGEDAGVSQSVRVIAKRWDAEARRKAG